MQDWRGSRCGLDDHPLSSFQGLQGASKPLLGYCFKAVLWFLEDGHFCYILAPASVEVSCTRADYRFGVMAYLCAFSSCKEDTVEAVMSGFLRLSESLGPSEESTLFSKSGPRCRFLTPFVSGHFSVLGELGCQPSGFVGFLASETLLLTRHGKEAGCNS
jgi:hypothetical protein